MKKLKRIYITLLILIFTAIICICEFNFVSDSSDDLVYKINTLEEIYKENQNDNALKLSGEIKDDWDKRVKKMDMLLYHDYVDAITINISKLPIYIREDETTEFYSTCREIKDSLLSLKKSETPNFENII